MLIVSVFTEFVLNAGAATLLVPITAGLATANNLNPLLYVIPTGMGASLAFILPTSTAPNTITLATGAFSFVDMNKAGLLMNLISVFTATCMVFAIVLPIVGVDVSGGLPDWAT
jgi:sodium-dependent dicarboxylate transporter 2/3/5